jgi:hybrid cluster-associated redox disulfide protein
MKTKMKTSKTKKVLKKSGKKITADMKIGDLIEENPEAMETLYEVGFGCVGCPMSVYETIGQGAAVHGMTKKDVQELVKELNRKRGK